MNEVGKISIDVLENHISDLELEKDWKIKKGIYTGEHEFDLCFYKRIDAEIKKKDKIIDEMAEALVKVPEDFDSSQAVAIAKMINSNLEEMKTEVIKYFEEKIENEIQEEN